MYLCKRILVLSLLMMSIGWGNEGNESFSNESNTNILTTSYQLFPSYSFHTHSRNIYEDTIGDPSTIAYSGDIRTRGNLFQVNVDRYLIEQQFYFSIDASTTIHFVVYECNSLDDICYLISDIPIESGTGERWYSSGDIEDVILESGKYYLLGASWEGTVTYFMGANQSEVSFGDLIGIFPEEGNGYYPPSNSVNGSLFSLSALQYYSTRYVTSDESLSNSGCTDSDACNYDPDAEEDDGSCEYPEGTCDCDGPIEDYCDCDGNMIDECGECGGDGYPCDEEVFYNILVFEDDTHYPYNGYEHLIFPNINLSIDSLFFVDDTNTFDQKITDGTNWDMVLYNSICCGGSSSNFELMSDYINDGGKLIYNNWAAGAFDNDNTLLENLGVVVTDPFTTPINFEAEPSSYDHPIFNTPNQISNLYWNDDNANFDGQYVSLINNSSALAVFEDYSDPAIILNEDNNAFFNAFSFTQYLDNDNDFDGVSDIFELIENQILFLLDSNNNFVLGDLNNDGEVNIYDIIILVSLVFDGEYNQSGDVNGDGILNIADCVLLVNLILGN